MRGRLSEEEMTMLEDPTRHVRTRPDGRKVTWCENRGSGHFLIDGHFKENASTLNVQNLDRRVGT